MDFIFRNTVGRNRQRNINVLRSNTFNIPKINGNNNTDVTLVSTSRKAIRSDRSWNTIVIIVLVEAKGLPPVGDDGATHTVFCKFKLGSESFRSKSVSSSQRPEWRERFQLHLYKDHSLNISLWDKGKMKNSMGSCVLDLSEFEKERTHEVWKQLDDGYGFIHLSVTMCTIRSADIPTKAMVEQECEEKHAISRMPREWGVVGLMHVNVIAARGFTSKPNAYCTLEIDNERVETHRAVASCEPKWNKCYVFKVYDVTSTLDLKVYDSSLTNALLNESIGKVSIPLLRITNGVTRWYALKDRNKRYNAKGNCPRVLLQMSMVWNPIKATTRLFQAKEVKYIKRSPKFDVVLIYSNMKFVSDLLAFAAEINEYYIRLFEWEDREFSFCVLLGWVIFCYYLRLWTVPLFALLPFFYFWLFSRQRDNVYLSHNYTNDDGLENIKEDKTFSGRLQDLQKMTLTITNGIEFIVSHIERLYNLITFKVPFLSYVCMLILLAASTGLYLIPFNYILMSLGIYKFTRKYINPNRVLNNDLLDFLSRVPDNAILKDWKELGVPEPNQDHQGDSSKLVRSISL